jgi:hypothetical protein
MDTPSLGKRPDNQIQRINKIYVVVSVTLTITMSTKKDMRRVDLGEFYPATMDCGIDCNARLVDSGANHGQLVDCL